MARQPKFFQKVKKDMIDGKPFDDGAEYEGFNPALANPDLLQETEIAGPSTPQLIMGEAIAHLQGRQRECYILTMREGKSFSEAAKILGIGKGRVQQYRERAIKFIEAWCKAQINKGRV